jgi:hypothetical protein
MKEPLEIRDDLSNDLVEKIAPDRNVWNSNLGME